MACVSSQGMETLSSLHVSLEKLFTMSPVCFVHHVPGKHRGMRDAKPYGSTPRLIVSMSFQLAIPWRVSLPQSPPPLHQPEAIMHERAAAGQQEPANGQPCLNYLSHPRGQAHLGRTARYKSIGDPRCFVDDQQIDASKTANGINLPLGNRSGKFAGAGSWSSNGHQNSSLFALCSTL